ncbi:hypothetical protein [Methylobacterium sp. WL103]|uniref:hypothetical protein n=1 Tax=Methylobacterium sp. WL103 TaxID=2603891 RepID=UPI002484A4B8|nr:hypothetical protein [Methylobacterium sp. WL103]
MDHRVVDADTAGDRLGEHRLLLGAVVAEPVERQRPVARVDEGQRRLQGVGGDDGGRIGPKISSCVTAIAGVASRISVGAMVRRSSPADPTVTTVAPLMRASSIGPRRRSAWRSLTMVLSSALPATVGYCMAIAAFMVSTKPAWMAHGISA